MLKKLFVSLIVLVTATFCTFAAYAEDANVYAKLDYAKDGEYLVNIMGENITGTTTLTIEVTYDDSKIEFKKSQMGVLLSNGLKVDNNIKEEAKYIVTYASTEGVEEDGVITSLLFNQLGNDGDNVDINVNVAQMTDKNSADIPHSVQNLSLSLGTEAEGNIDDYISSKIDYDKTLKPKDYGMNNAITVSIDGSVSAGAFLGGNDFTVLGTDDPSIASFENDRLTGVANGNTVVLVETPDGVMGIDVIVTDNAGNAPAVTPNTTNNNNDDNKKMSPIAIGVIILAVAACVLYIVIAPDSKKSDKKDDNNDLDDEDDDSEDNDET